MNKAPQLIIALDFDNVKDVFTLVDKLCPKQCSLKVGSELFTLFGASLVKQLIAKDFCVFLDLKFHDIPNTVANACKAAADLGVWMMNVHASGGFKMMQAASKALEPYGVNKPLLLAVTVLTSMSEEELPSIGIQAPLIKQVQQLALLAKSAGLDGVVCSAFEVKEIKAVCGEAFIALTPGIRLASSQHNDQQRIMTPKEALLQGSDYLVMGRPITQADNPAGVLAEIYKEIN
jgi:orotidine-5'-phosphate decarboxylase